jgi:FtsZ-binding cell division protein ZapB
MSKTTTAHAASDLRFVTLDESGEIAYFHSDSQSKPGTVNVTALDLATEDTFCFCKAAECGHTCWHVVYVAAAWRMVAHRVRCQQMTMAELVAHGQSLVKYVQDAERDGHDWLAANFRQQLDEARIVWQERRAAQVAPAALVAA